MIHSRALAVTALAAILVGGPCRAQVAGFSFSNVAAGTNDPVTLGGAANPFDVWSDSGPLVKATFSTQSPSTQFGIRDNSSGLPIGDAPISGNLLFGGRSGYPTAADGAGTARLQVKFSEMLTGISFDFLTGAQAPTGGSVALDLIIGAEQAGSTFVLASGSQSQNSSGYYFQSQATVSTFPLEFDTLVFSVTPPTGDLYGEFGLDNLKVTLAPKPTGQVPEPGAAAMLLGLVAPLIWSLRRRNR